MTVSTPPDRAPDVTITVEMWSVPSGTHITICLRSAGVAHPRAEMHLAAEALTRAADDDSIDYQVAAPG